MKCMHHNSLKSQLIYTSPTQERVRTELDIAEKKLQEKISKYPSKVDKLSTNASYENTIYFRSWKFNQRITIMNNKTYINADTGTTRSKEQIKIGAFP